MTLHTPALHPQRHPLGGKIVFSYGMTKCGSTLAFELARTALDLEGFPQPNVCSEILGLRRKINFAHHIDETQAAGLAQAATDLRHPLVIKTHTRPDPVVIELINRGQAMVHATYRDPRDMALSLLDQGRISRAKDSPAFAEIETLSDVIINI